MAWQSWVEETVRQADAASLRSLPLTFLSTESALANDWNLAVEGGDLSWEVCGVCLILSYRAQVSLD